MDKEKLTAYKLIREEDLTDIHSGKDIFFPTGKQGQG